MFGRILDATARREHGRILAGLIRACGNFDLAEEALQDAYLKAATHWQAAGIPDHPGAWLTTVARHRLVDLIRRDARTVEDSDAIIDALEAPASDAQEDSRVADDQLRLIFTCCHPAIAPSAATALALRTLCGLTTREIARAFVEPETTTAQKLVRAKRKIGLAKIPYVIPPPSELPERLGSVLAVIYLVFNEGYAATESATLVRAELCNEAIRLARLLVSLLPDKAECHGLLALMLLHDSRRLARVSADGELIPLEEQSRSQWDRTAISEGLRHLDLALLQRQAGPYQLQAAIAALHAQAETAAATDWNQIAFLYLALLRHLPTPVVELNAAVAMAMSGDFEKGLHWIAQIEARGDLKDYYLLPAARADLLRRAGLAGAADAYRAALALVKNDSERRYLLRRLNTVTGTASVA
jgi:RNA polymerase sigma-70 factor, ECF subfamily